MSNENERSGELFVVAGPSGAGKSSLVRALVGEGPHHVPGLRFSVSHTTRPKRAGEVDGREYHFVEEDTFLGMVNRGEFLEWARVHRSLYGTSRTPVADWIAEGYDVLLDVDVQGAAQVRVAWPGARLVFILPPSLEALIRRLEGRGSEGPAELRLRLENARREVGRWEEFDYVIVNEDLEAAARELSAVVVEKRVRRERSRFRAEQIVAAFEQDRP